MYGNNSNTVVITTIIIAAMIGGLYWLTDGAYQTMFMVTDKGVVAVDIGSTIQSIVNKSTRDQKYSCNNIGLTNK